jgi:homoaconitate hydratase
MVGQTLVEKIAQRFAVGLADGHTVHSGDYLSIRPAHVMTHDNTAAVIPKFEKMGAAKIADPGQPVFTLDHDIQNTAPENLGKYSKIESFAKKQGVAFYPAGRGIGHQVMVEEGYVLPGSLVVASDSHSNLYGGMAALGTPVVRTDAAAIWATGRTWWQVPDVARVRFTGKLQPGVVGKDVIIALCGVFNNDEVLNCCVEFTGPGVAELSMEERLTISNMTTEWGALAGVFPYDDVTRDYLLARAAHFKKHGYVAPRITAEVVQRLAEEAPHADDDAFYAKELEFDLSAVTPFISGPNTVKTITALPELEQQGVKINKAYLMSCVNGRLQDFEAAAGVVKGQRVADHVEFYLAAASDEVEREAKQRGLWKTLTDAGAIELPPGCGACIGLGRGTLEAGEVGISATNRNFKGRMGSREAAVYLASPAVVAASAIAGKIASPTDVAAGAPAGRSAGEHRQRLEQGSACRTAKRPAAPTAAVEILPGFPERIDGELLLVPQDNLNTDGIYGKDYTYKEGMTPDQMAAVAMENYDPEFQKLAKEGDILVGGYNFGSGSSREQAATALKYRGIAMIIAGSFSQTYKRNAFNNGYVCIECPELVDELKAAHAGDQAPTIRTGQQTTVDFMTAKLSADGKEYSFSPLGEIAQELVVAGGFEAVICGQLEREE